MTNFMEFFINMTIATSVTGLLILVIKALLKDRLAPRWHFFIWIILGVRLILPVFPQSEISIFNMLPSGGNLISNASFDGGATVNGDVGGESKVGANAMAPVVANQEAKQVGDASLAENQTFLSQSRMTSIEKSVKILWPLGAAATGIYLLGVYLVFLRKTKGLPECSDLETLEILEDCKALVGMKKEREIVILQGCDTPMLKGVRKPTILIPRGFAKAELRYIFLHELCHLKHKDIWINSLCVLLLCIHWYNPIIWICFFAVKKDVELLCDQRALELIKERKEYANVLLKTALRKNQFILATTSMQNGEKAIASRIKKIASTKTPKKYMVIIAGMIVAILGAGCLTNPVEKTQVYDIGMDYSICVPQDWEQISAQKSTDFQDQIMSFGLDKDHIFMQIQLAEDVTDLLPLGRDAKNIEKREIKDLPVKAVFAKEDNENHLYLYPSENKKPPYQGVYDIWGMEDKVSEKELIQIAFTFEKSKDPKDFKPKMKTTKDGLKDGKSLVDAYFKNYLKMKLPKERQLSEYTVTAVRPLAENGWMSVYPNVEVFEVTYVLEPIAPKGSETKWAVIVKDEKGESTLLGFLSPEQQQSSSENEVMHFAYFHQMQTLSEKLVKNKNPYIGNASKNGNLIQLLPMAQRTMGMELQTTTQPYGMTINYQLDGYENTQDVKAFLFQNAAILLSLIDNGGSVTINVMDSAGGNPLSSAWDYSLTLSWEDVAWYFKNAGITNAELKKEEITKSAQIYMDEFLVPLYYLHRGTGFASGL